MYEYKATVKRVVDGDTIDCVIDLGFYMTASIRFRLVGVNAPETKGVSRPAGLSSKAFLEELLAAHGNVVRVQTEKTGKYGRWLATVWVGELNVNEELVKSGYAEKYS